MKIKLLFAFLLVSFFAVAQPTNYQRIAARYKWIAGMYDSTLHIPSGVTPAFRGGGWTGAGAIFFNTSDSSLYVYSGYQWRKIGDDVDSLIYSTRAWRQKGDDSLGAVKWGLTGNSGTNPATNFIGTTDAQPLIFKVNNLRSGYINNISRTVGFGYKVLENTTTGLDNSGFGHLALNSLTIGTVNAAFGTRALEKGVNASFNTAVGHRALMECIDCYDNVAIGYIALSNNISGIQNTIVGTNSGNNILSNSNTILGFNSGTTLTTGSGNTIIGANIQGDSAGVANNIYIGDGVGNVRIKVNNIGSVGVGTLTPDTSSLLDVTSTSKGILIPRMTTTQRNAISLPAIGLMIYNTTDSAFNFYRTSGWSAIGGGSGSYTFSNGLTEAAGAAKLGGTLTDATTTIMGNNKQVYFDSLKGFIIKSRNSDFPNTAYVSVNNEEGVNLVHTNASLNVADNIVLNTNNVVEIRGQDTIYLSSNNIKIPTLPYTLSTTGKKILLRDTATGLVQNIDPALLGGGSTNTSVGSGYKVAIDATNNIKSLTGGYGITLDSATSNQVGIKADTATLFPAVRATIPAGGTGNVTKVGTPVDNQIGVWTGDGTLEGDAELTWDGAMMQISNAEDVQLKLNSTGAWGGLQMNSATSANISWLEGGVSKWVMGSSAAAFSFRMYSYASGAYVTEWIPGSALFRTSYYHQINNANGIDVRGRLLVNEDGADYDSRIEGDTDPNLFFVDASTDRVGIGTNAPSVKLDVVGGLKATAASGYATNINGSLSGNNFATINYVDSSKIIEGTYTPSYTNTTNVSASTAYTTNYTRIGDWYHVWGEVDIDATAATTISEMSMTLPVSTSFANTRDLAGTASFEDNTTVQIKGDVSNGTAKWRFTPQTDTNNKYSFHFSFKYSTP